MATVSLWSNVAVAMQSAISATQVVSSVTKASPGLLTYVGADTFTAGDFVLITAVGMTQINGRVFRVANVTAGSNTLELEGENTTNYDTLTSGTIALITYGTSLSTLTGLNASGGDFEFADTTTIHDAARSQVPTVATPATYNFESFWDVADTGLIALKAASLLKSTRAMKFTFANSQKLVFNGYVGCTLIPGGQAQDKVTTNVTITMFGSPTVYSS